MGVKVQPAEGDMPSFDLRAEQKAPSLFVAALNDDVVSFEFLWRTKGMLLTETQPYYKRTPVQFCCANNSVKCLELVAKHCTDDELTELCVMKDWMHKNTAHVAANAGHTEACLLLFKWFFEGKLKKDIFEEIDVLKNTPMRWAAEKGFADLSELFVIRCFIMQMPKANIRDHHTKKKLFHILQLHGYDLEEQHVLDKDASNVDFKVNESLIVDVIQAAYLEGGHIVKVLLEIERYLNTGKFFGHLVPIVSNLLLKLIDTCRNKEEVRAIVAPFKIVHHNSQGQETYNPVTEALRNRNMEFIAHPEVTAMFMERWDPFGSYVFASNVGSFPFFFICTMALYMVCLAVMPLTCLLRPFIPWVNTFSMRSRERSSMLYLWQIPFVRWLANYVVMFTWLIIFTLQAFAVDPPEMISWREWALLAYSIGLIVDEAQDMTESRLYASDTTLPYTSDCWNVFDLGIGFSYLGYFGVQIAYLNSSGRTADDATEDLNCIAIGQVLMGIAVGLMWIRMLEVLEVTESIGPLLEALRIMIAIDFTRIFILAGVVLLGFTCSSFCLFRTICIHENTVDENCYTYNENWETDWPEKNSFSGLVGSAQQLLAVLWGTTSTTGFNQKNIAGPILLLLFNISIAVILMNLFIAMLADTYTNIRAQAIVQSRFRRAYTIATLGARECIYVPINLINLIAGLLGTLIWYPFTRKPAIRFRKDDPAIPLFLWIIPAQQPDNATKYAQRRQAVFDLFVKTIKMEQQESRWGTKMVELITKFIKKQDPLLYSEVSAINAHEVVDE